MSTFTTPTKRTTGKCNCYPPPAGGFKHDANCPSLYPLQPQPGDEPDTLTRLARLVRTRRGMSGDAFEHATLDLIARARAGQTALKQARDDALSKVEHMERQRAHVAKSLGVADGGLYQNDWDAPVRRALARARNEGLERAARLLTETFDQPTYAGEVRALKDSKP